MKKSLLTLAFPILFAASGLAQKTGTGKAIINPLNDFDFSFAKVYFLKEGTKDTISYQADWSGQISYNLPVNSPTNYQVIIQPQKSKSSKNNNFNPYITNVFIKEGENNILIL